MLGRHNVPHFEEFVQFVRSEGFVAGSVDPVFFKVQSPNIYRMSRNESSAEGNDDIVLVLLTRNIDDEPDLAIVDDDIVTFFALCFG